MEDLTPIEGAGRALSKSNAEKAKAVLKAIYELLSGSGVISDKEIADELGMALPTYAPIASTAIEETQSSEVAGMRLKERVDLATWGERFESVMEQFKERFCMLHKADNDSIVGWLGNDFKDKKDTSLPTEPKALRKALIAQARADLNEILDDLVTSAPDAGDRWLPEIDATRAELTEIAATAAQALDAEPQTHRIVLGRSTLPTNRREFRGVLFAIDKPSAAAPEGLGGLPLLVTRSVAEAAARNVAGLPLNAAKDLSRHDKPSVVGHMRRAEIAGPDFVVEGHLYDHNRPELTSEIAAQAGDLGMSLEAYIKGAEATVAGQSVFVASELVLTGATIARQDRVAYGSDTRVLAATVAESQASEQAVLVTAATDQPVNPTQLELDMTISPELTNQLSALGDQISQLTNLVTALADKTNVVAGEVERINEERRVEAEKAKAVEAQKAEEAKQAEQAKRFEEMVAAAVAKVQQPIAATRAPQPRQTVNPVAIAAAGAGGETLSVAAQIDQEIATVQAQIDLVRSLPTYDSSTDIRLTEQMRVLQMKRQAIPA